MIEMESMLCQLTINPCVLVVMQAVPMEVNKAVQTVVNRHCQRLTLHCANFRAWKRLKVGWQAHSRRQRRRWLSSCYGNDFTHGKAIKVGWNLKYIQVVSPRAALLRDAVPYVAILAATSTVTIAHLTTVKLKMAEGTTVVLLPTAIMVTRACCAVKQPVKTAARTTVAVANAALVKHT